ncbi:MAG TPA: hypothetical protein DEA97_03925 [Bacteroidales bacterium]|nr:MAG: hypothetical protein UR43_C0016G0015 [candidate division TM6 bacterium GW2011_GWF2_33_332]HBS85678.1 hypothetical protein [Bacteroidales bacterium]
MIKYFIALLLLIFSITNVFSQEGEGDSYSVEFQISKAKIRGHLLKILITEVDSTAILKVFDNYKDIDTTFTIPADMFDQIMNLVRKIDIDDLFLAMKTTGFDGTKCILIFGNYQNKLTYQIWSPNYLTKERKLKTFLKACELILKIAGINEDQYF